MEYEALKVRAQDEHQEAKDSEKALGLLVASGAVHDVLDCRLVIFLHGVEKNDVTPLVVRLILALRYSRMLATESSPFLMTTIKADCPYGLKALNQHHPHTVHCPIRVS